MKYFVSGYRCRFIPSYGIPYEGMNRVGNRDFRRYGGKADVHCYENTS